MGVNTIFINALMLIAVLNPFGNVPLFIGMTEGMEKEIRKKLFKAIALTGFFITFLFSLVGEFLMINFYKIDMNELRMAGGLILVLMAVKNLIFPPMKKEREEAHISPEEQIKQAVIPMAFPMMVGPGSLTTALIGRSEYGVVYNSLSILTAFAVIFMIFVIGNYLEKIFGKLVLYILSKVMQIFIMSIGFRIFFDGFFKMLELKHGV
ncbi:MarC family protein [Fusobacterium varium]|uniref:MarC family protein n=1 Tax=Fusobacterium varium TaxID=856 RepID=UPI000E41F4B3|nr:MarC family protein [Fusobacterium varium]MCI6033368.1 MarC family protein [Fusobacterium varium]MDY4006705.1 MarC family protein [Fusobacterium varium]RGJ30164.1 MarC family protein [Fusobacterium varium]